MLQVLLQFEHITEVLTAFGDNGVSAEAVAQTMVREVQSHLAQTHRWVNTWRIS